MPAHVHHFAKSVSRRSVWLFCKIHIRNTGSSCSMRRNHCPLWFYTFSLLINLDLLAIDDLGTEPREVMDYGNIINPTVDILTRRYENQLFTIISTNLTPPDFSQVYGERIADRMREMMEKIPFNNSSYRSIK